MKFSILSSLVIVALTAVLAITQGTRVGNLKESRTTLQQRALALGISLEGSHTGKSELEAAVARGGGGGGAQRGRSAGTQAGTTADPEQAASDFAAELFALVTRMKEFEKKGEQPSLEMQRELFTFLARFMELDPAVIPHLIAEVRATDKFDKNEKQGILMMSFMSLSKASPERALDLYINSGDLLGREAEHVVGMALGSWAAQDPRAALDWIDLNAQKLPDKTAAGARKLAIANAFTSDPSFAVEKTLALKKEDVLELSQQLARIVPTPQEQLDLLRSIQGKLGALPTDPDQINEDALKTASNDQVLRGGLLVGLGGTLARQPFDSATRFLDTAKLTPIETLIVAKGVSGKAQDLQDPGPWINWIDSNAPPADRAQSTSQIVEQWTQKDFRSTAAWIGEQPRGDLRDRATFTFAKTVAPHEPDAAADWALELPASQERTGLLRTIHQHWQGKDPAAAATFAAKHGIEE